MIYSFLIIVNSFSCLSLLNKIEEYQTIYDKSCGDKVSYFKNKEFCDNLDDKIILLTDVINEKCGIEAYTC